MTAADNLAKLLGQDKDYPRLLADVNELIRSQPPRATLRDELPENLAWFGRLSAVITAWDSGRGMMLSLHMSRFRDGGPGSSVALVQMIDLLYQARADLMLKTDASPSAVIEQGAVFHYFDELRKIIEGASTDLFFIDPYLDAEFVSRYFGQVRSGVTIRLLTQKKPEALVAAVQQWVSQYGGSVKVRSDPNMHDRFVIVDGRDVYLSGASFKDGARNAGTVLSNFRDGGPALRDTYEAMWKAARVLL
jgi:hypothetical protein